MTATGSVGTTERELLLRVLSTLLREDVVGLRSRGVVRDRPDGRWLRLDGAEGRALDCRWSRTDSECAYAAGCRCCGWRRRHR
ncbi:hypothetical protein GTW78_28335, partial [Streptomyces sp. SID4948]|nr:hypothetical protein [Streptomyces sp. SID4948]